MPPWYLILPGALSALAVLALAAYSIQIHLHEMPYRRANRANKARAAGRVLQEAQR